MPTLNHPRLVRERKTLEAMVGIYCRGTHGTTDQLCDDCSRLFRYALRRLERCPYQEAKPTCAKCPIHCYKPDARKQIKEVMHFAGPRILTRHPSLAILHLLDGWQSDRMPEPVRSTEAGDSPQR